MGVMRDRRGCHVWAWPLLLVLLLTAACSRPVNVPTEGTSEGAQAPFRGSQAPENPPEASDSQSSGSSQSAVPSRESQNVPAGTLLTVRLREPLTAGTPEGADSFEAVVDQPLVVGVSTLVPRGAMVVGRVESAKISKLNPERAYVRLALASLHVGGVDVPLQTTSLYARPASQGSLSDSAVHLEKGRRLTFRLTEAVSLNSPRTEASR